MKRKGLISVIFTVSFSLFLASCDDNITVLTMPKDKKGGYCVSKVSHRKWTGRGGKVILLDKDNNEMSCTGGKPRMVENSLSCIGKKFLVDFKCFDGSTADVEYTSISCSESVGSAKLSTGREFDLYIGLSEEFINTKIAEYKMEQQPE